MHEISIADMLVGQIQQAVAKEGLVRVNEVTIRVGVHSELNLEELEEALFDRASRTDLGDVEFSLTELQPGDSIFDGEIAVSPGDDLPPQGDVWGSDAVERGDLPHGPRIATGREIVVSRIDGMHTLDEGGTDDFDEGYLSG